MQNRKWIASSVNRYGCGICQFFDTTIDYIILGITEEDENNKAIRKINEEIEILLERKAELLKQKNKK